jgi:hypothetical protein
MDWLAPSKSAWQPSELGDTHVFHHLGHYVQDLSGSSSEGRHHTDRCNKNQHSNQKLIPGIMSFYCMGCHKCVMFSRMRDAESRRTVASLLHTHMPAPLQRLYMDNVCTVHAFLLNRELAQYANTQGLIDDCQRRITSTAPRPTSQVMLVCMPKLWHCVIIRFPLFYGVFPRSMCWQPTRCTIWLRATSQITPSRRFPSNAMQCYARWSPCAHT